ELFPTEIRASAFGIATAISRIGAAIGTFALPWVLQHGGTQITMLLAAGITLLGLIICIFWAPETKGKTLAQCGQLDDTEARHQD
ncbi:MAG TPA: MFS transporter, partial [Clostridiales bacterium]|nr:MFS transporter [Clostridiales bacterium]